MNKAFVWSVIEEKKKKKAIFPNDKWSKMYAVIWVERI